MMMIVFFIFAKAVFLLLSLCGCLVGCFVNLAACKREKRFIRMEGRKIKNYSYTKALNISPQ
jgi:hypothetical protein